MGQLKDYWKNDMCGRFVRITPIPVIAKKFRAKQLFTGLALFASSQETVNINDEG